MTLIDVSKVFLLHLAVLFGVLKGAAQQVPRAPTSKETRSATQQRVKQQNAAATHSARAQNPQAEIQEARADFAEEERALVAVSYEFPDVQHPSAAYFQQSVSELQSMLDGQQDISLKRAVFLSENAFLDNALSYEGFCSDIASNIDILQAFMRKEGLDETNDIAKKYMLQKFFSETLTMHDDKDNYQFTHYPFKYDFEDPFAKQDWQKMFVSKLLRDKKGQCHSLPLLYLIFAEELNVKAWLSYSPQHSYIKTQDSKGVWYNFETTNGQYSSNSWVLSSGYVKTEALKNKIFMDTLSKRATIATCFVDLAKGYTDRFGYDKFALSCAEKALATNPKNIYALQLKADYYTLLFKHVAKQLHYPPKEKLYLYPKAQAIFQKAHALYAQIDKLGYEDMPENMYEAWLKSFEREKGKQPIKIIKP